MSPLDGTVPCPLPLSVCDITIYTQSRKLGVTSDTASKPYYSQFTHDEEGYKNLNVKLITIINTN